MAGKRLITFEDSYEETNEDQTDQVKVTITTQATPLELDADLLLSTETAAIKTVETESQCQAAGALLRKVKGRRKTIQRFYKPLCDAAYKAWKTMTGRRAGQDGPYERAEEALREMIEMYLTRQLAQQAAVAGPEVVTSRKLPEMAGITTSIRWAFTITDPTKLPWDRLFAVAKVCEAVESAIRADVNRFGKLAEKQYPGIAVTEHAKIAVQPAE